MLSDKPLRSSTGNASSGAASAVSVSVVVPCFNTHRTLPRTLASLRAQTMPPLEVVIVDDGSTDPETVAFLDKLSGVRLVRQKNKGLPGARNAGIRAAAGTHVLLLDADDWLAPNAIERLVATLQENPDCAYASSHIVLEGEASGVLSKSYNFFEQLFLNQLPYCILMPKRVWEVAGGYSEMMRQGYEDWEFNIRLGRLGYHGAIAHEPLFHYWVSGTGMLQSVSTRLHGELWRDIQERNPELYTWSKLLKAWSEWRRQPSTYPLVGYFAWLVLYRVLPHGLFQSLFNVLLPHSHAKRTNQRRHRVMAKA
jgi:glycosyltransferase involved in cell wall biosynthesis